MDTSHIPIDTTFYHFVDIMTDLPTRGVLMTVGVGRGRQLYGKTPKFYNTFFQGRSRVCFCNIHKFNQHSYTKVISLELQYSSRTGAKLIKIGELEYEQLGQTVHGLLLATESPKTVSELTYLCAKNLTHEQYMKLPQTDVFQRRTYLKARQVSWTLGQEVIMEHMDTCRCNE